MTQSGRDSTVATDGSRRRLADGGHSPGSRESQANPRLAGVPSFLVPGLGHLYAGYGGKGVVRFGQTLVSWTLVSLCASVVIPFIATITAGIGAVLYLLLPVWLLIIHGGFAIEAAELASQETDGREPSSEAGTQEQVTHRSRTTAGNTGRPATLQELEERSYQELQQLAKELGIRANQSIEDLQSMIASELGLDIARPDGNET